MWSLSIEGWLAGAARIEHGKDTAFPFCSWCLYTNQETCSAEGAIVMYGRSAQCKSAGTIKDVRFAVMYPACFCGSMAAGLDGIRLAGGGEMPSQMFELIALTIARVESLLASWFAIIVVSPSQFLSRIFHRSLPFTGKLD